MMDNNILYKNQDMLSVMESCEDNSKDFILLFMPSNMGGTIGDNACRPVFRSTDCSESENRDFNRFKYLDYGSIHYSDKQSFDDYIDLVGKVIQNAGRILSPKGVFCFGMPKEISCVDGSESQKPQIKLLLQQTFDGISITDIPNFSINADTRLSPYDYSKYNLYFCSKGGGFSEYYDEVYDLKWPTDSAIGKFYAKYKDVLSSRIPREKGWLLSESLTAVRLLNMLMIPELRRKKYIEMAMELNSKMPSGKGTKEEKLALCNETEQKIREELTKIAEDKSNYIPLAESLMLTFCEADSKLLFPYDRAGQYAAIADKLGLNWVSLYKASCSIDAAYYFQKSMERYADVEKATQMTSRLYGKDHVDYLEGINPEHYEERITIPDHKPVQYDSNYLSSAKDVNALKSKYSKVSGILNDIIECAAENGMENSEDMEQAVHYVMQMAVKGETKVDAEKLARKWYGKGYDELSDKCQTFLRTAITFEHMTDGATDKAPVMLEYSRALEQELNSTLIRDFITYIRDNTDDVLRIVKNAKRDNDTVRFIRLLEAILNNESMRGMTLGEISQCIKMAARASDGDIYGIFAKFCKQDGHENLLESNTVGRYGMAAKLRNLCAHPYDIDDGCMNQNRQLVLEGLKTQQSRGNGATPNTESPICAIIGPDHNKMKYPVDTAKMEAAIKNQILMLYQSGVRRFTSTGNSGFDLLVAEILLACKHSGDAKSIELTEYLPCERNEMKFAPNRKKRILAIDKHAVIEVCADGDNAANRSICQDKALENAAFCIAFYAEDGQSAIASKVKDALQRGTIVYNTYSFAQIAINR